MNKIILTLVLLLTVLSIETSAQNKSIGEKYGNALNLGVGIGGYSGYYRYVGHSLPVFHLNYEFGLARNFTLAPFVSISSFSKKYYWGDKDWNYPYRYYVYRETVIPVGAKVTYYFDDLISAGNDWDFYLAGSLGFSIVRFSWENDNYGDSEYFNHGNSLFLDLHLGTEYHFNEHLGAFLDLSTGVSTIGLAIH